MEMLKFLMNDVFIPTFIVLPVPREMYKWNEPAYNFSSFKENKNSY